jgi:exonuclease SbcC
VEATAILMELSGGQYELTADSSGAFEIVDHNDADTARPVKTLSGGETFQAALSLALALAGQLAGLSGARTTLDSIFLDEGFGTLDAATLDTVAATLEGLAADGDRMVGVVTHVPALADRIPVRFDVSKTSAGASVVRSSR